MRHALSSKRSFYRQSDRAGILATVESYLATVEEVYAALRKSGLFLSPADRAQVLEWQQAGIPLAAVLRALAEGLHGYRAAGQGVRPRSLRWFDRQVREEGARN